MKVTKRILREMIEAEINLLNEATERTGFLNIRGAQRTIEKLGKRLRKYLAAEEGSNQQDRRRQRFLRLWNAISGGVVKDDLEIDGNKTELGNVVDEARAAGLISQEETTNIDNDLTASGRSDPDPTRTQQQMAAAIEENEAEEEAEEEEGVATPEEPPGDTEASSSDSVSAQEGGETDLSAESTEMLTTMKTQGGILKRGSSGSKVGLLQDALRSRLGTMSHQWLGAAGQSDSDFGGKTKAAVEAIQTKYGITKDGVVGPNTAASLLADAAATGTAPARRRPAPSAGGEPAAQEEETRPTNPFGGQGQWNEDAEVWYADGWDQASAAAEEGGFITSVKIENDDTIYYVKIDGDNLTTDDIDDLQGIDDGMNEASSYFNRFTQILNEIEHMKDERTYSDVASEEAEEEAPAEEEARMSDDLIVLKVELRGFNEIANLTDSELDTALRTIDGMTIQEFEPLRRQAYRELNVAYKTKVADLLKSISGFPENKIDSFSANVHSFVDIEKDDDDSKISVTKISSHWPRTILPNSDQYNNINGKIAFFYAERGRLAPRVNVELFDKTIDVVGVSQFIVVRDALRKIKQFINENQDASAGGGTAAQGTEDAPTVDNANPLPGQSVAVQPESLSYDRFSKLAGIFLD